MHAHKYVCMCRHIRVYVRIYTLYIRVYAYACTQATIFMVKACTAMHTCIYAYTHIHIYVGLWQSIIRITMCAPLLDEFYHYRPNNKKGDKSQRPQGG